MYDYVGNLNIGVSGTTCVRWDAKALFTTDVFPDKARNHSHCRNPGRSQDKAWCYVSLVDNSHEACDIPSCPANYKKIAITKSDSNVYKIHSCHIWYGSRATSPAIFVYNKQLDQSEFQMYCSRFNISYIFCNVLDQRQSAAALTSPAWVRFLVDCDEFTSSSVLPTSYTTAISPVTVTDYSISDILSLSLTVTVTSPCSYSSIMDSSESTALSMQSTTTTHESSLNIGSIFNPSDQQTLVTTPLLSGILYSSVATPTPMLSNIAQPLSQPSSNLNMALILNSLNPSNQQNFVTTSSISKSLYSSVTTLTPILPRTTQTFDHQTLSQPPSLSSLSTISPSPIRPDASLATPASSRKFCACGCKTKTLTGAKLSENMKKVAKELTVEKKTLSASIRKITSAVDNRPSAVSMGYTGVILLTMALVIMIVPDLTNVLYFLKNKTRHHELE
ncbi:uncharacterized protein LOC126827560 isoform X2 [Patella vulgata]|nr:uncharacterized protein LOC126827560 isoform X2 [Patella vulgata]